MTGPSRRSPRHQNFAYLTSELYSASELYLFDNRTLFILHQNFIYLDIYLASFNGKIISNLIIINIMMMTMTIINDWDDNEINCLTKSEAMQT